MDKKLDLFMTDEEEINERKKINFTRIIYPLPKKINKQKKIKNTFIIKKSINKNC